jgi:hypothetical protein
VIDIDSDVFFAPKPIVYPREQTFTVFRLMSLASAIAGGWVLGHSHPEVAVSLAAVCVVGIVVRRLIANPGGV